jgi:hypothetical protein
MSPPGQLTARCQSSRGEIAYREYVSPDDSALVEVLILGELIVRTNGAVAPGLSPALAETLTLLAAYGRPMTAEKLGKVHSLRPSKGAFEQYITRLNKRFDALIVSGGSRGSTTYQLDPVRCHVDATEFVQGVDAGRDVDDLLRLWRANPEVDLASPPWAAVKEARTRLIKRIADLPEEEYAALAELARFEALFHDDQELDKIRPSGPHSKHWLLVVEDNPEMMEEICGRLEKKYNIKQIRDIRQWRDFRKVTSQLDKIHGALIDLSLTPSGRDNDGLEIARDLQDTEIPVALVTANRMESTEFLREDRMAEYRLVDIVDKTDPNWFNALRITAALLVGDGVVERRRRMQTWLKAAYRNFRREASDPGSLAFARRREWDDVYAKALGLAAVGDVDEAAEAVGRFCRTWPTSD